jgi:hypothetical protein
MQPWVDTAEDAVLVLLTTLGHPFGGPIFSPEERLKGGRATLAYEAASARNPSLCSHNPRFVADAASPIADKAVGTVPPTALLSVA